MIDAINPVNLASKAIHIAVSPLLGVMRALPVPPSPPNHQDIDFSKPILVFWLPGTSNHSIPEEFSTFAKKHWGANVQIILVDYAASWQFNTSVPDGTKKLSDILDFVAKNKRAGQKVYVAGESQGALIAGSVVSQPKYHKLVDKTALMGHPGISPQHFHEANGKVLEINNSLDPATFEWEGDYTELLTAMDKLARSDPSGIPTLLKAGLSRPIYTIALALLQLQNIDVVRKFLVNTHSYKDRMEYAVLWLGSK